MHESEELSRLANKESIGRESVKRSHCSTSGFGWANNRTRRKFLIKKHGGLRHDQVSLKIFSAQWRGIQVGERDRYASHRIYGVGHRRCIARLIRPCLEVHDLGPTNSEQDSQNFRAGHPLGQLRIETTPTLLDRGKVKTRGVANRFQEIVLIADRHQSGELQCVVLLPEWG